jgi:transposase
VAAALHEAEFFVSVINPTAIHQTGNGVSVRKVKNDRKDAIKIAKFGLDNWTDLREYTPMDTVRQQLKLFSRQYNLYMKTGGGAAKQSHFSAGQDLSGRKRIV